MPTHSLPQIPCRALKFLNAMSTPYMVAYRKMKKYAAPTIIIRYSTRMLHIFFRSFRRLCAFVSDRYVTAIFRNLLPSINSENVPPRHDKALSPHNASNSATPSAQGRLPKKSHPPRLSAVDENEPPSRPGMPASRRPACRPALRSFTLVLIFYIADILRTRLSLSITGHFLTFRNTRRPPGTPLWQGADPSRPTLFPHARRAEYARSAFPDRAHTEYQSDAFLLPAPLFAAAVFCAAGEKRRLVAGLSASADFNSTRTFR